MSREETKQQHLVDFLAEVRDAAFRYALENYVGGRKKIKADSEITTSYCGVLGVRMAIVWGVTRGTANRRLQALAGHGVQRAPRYGFSHCDRYHAPDELVLQYIREGIQHWLAVGYSQTELRDTIETEQEVAA